MVIGPMYSDSVIKLGLLIWRFVGIVGGSVDDEKQVCVKCCDVCPMFSTSCLIDYCGKRNLIKTVLKFVKVTYVCTIGGEYLKSL